MNDLQIFNNAEFGEIRTITEDGKTLFCGSDVARALGYARPNEAVAAHAKGTVKRRTPTNGGTQEMSFIPEGDVYRLITRSQLPTAERFEHWVFDEVLPSIRKHGMYATEELLNNPDLAIKAFTALKEEREARKRLEAKVAADQPKVLFADSVAASQNSISVNELAKLIQQNGIPIGQNRLFAWLRENGFLIRQRGESWNIPTQKAMERGLFEVKVSTCFKPDGSAFVSRTTKVTGKGSIYFINRLRNEYSQNTEVM